MRSISRGCGGHPPFKHPESQIQPGPCCRHVSSATLASPTLATCCGSTGNVKGASALGNAEEQVPALGGAGRRLEKEHPWWGQGSKQSPPKAPQGCMQQAPLTVLTPQPLCRPTPAAPGEANLSSKGWQWALPGCHSPTEPRSPRRFHAGQGSSARACPAHGG